jgi:hypothetical protein
LLAALTESSAESSQTRWTRTRSFRRFVDLTNLLGDRVNGDKRLVTGATLDERVTQFEALTVHVRGLWRDAV